MRIRRLDLERYGSFEGRGVAFREDAALHLVHGSNEAGKSTALAAVADLLFGFEARTRFDFRFLQQELRLGGEVCDGRDNTLAFRRRKGLKNTLMDAAGQSIGDDALAPYLGGFSRSNFTTAFGLSQDALRSGGNEMLKSGGAVGESLMAAASGTRGLVALRDTLDREADDLFATRRSGKRAFYLALDRYEAARRQVSVLTLRFEAWRSLNDEIAAAQDALAANQARRQEIALERSRLTRQRRVAPLLAELDNLRRAARELEPLPQVDVLFADRAEAALAAHDEARREHARAVEAQAASARRVAELAFDDTILSAAEEVERLQATRGAVLKADLDLPRRREAQAAAHAALADLARRLGLDGVETLIAACPSEIVLGRLGRLVRRAHTMLQDKAALNESHAAAIAEASALEQRRDRLGSSFDPEPLRRRLVAQRASIEAFADATRRRSELETGLRELGDAAARLAPPVDDLERVARLSLPRIDEVHGFADRFAAVEKAAALLRAAQTAAEARVAQIEREREALAAEGEIADAETLAEARAARDALLVRVAALLGGTPAPGEGPVLALDLDRAVRRADLLADRRASEAERESRHRELQRQAARLADELAAIRRNITEGTRAGEALAVEWAEYLAPLGMAAETPARVARWLQDVAGLIEQRDRLARMRDEIEAGFARGRAGLPELRAILREAGSASCTDADPAALAILIEDRLGEAGEVWQGARSLADQAAAAQGRAQEAAGKLALLSEAEQALGDEWRQVMPQAGLAPDAAIDDAERAQEIWSQAPARIEALKAVQRQIATMERDRDQFEREVAALSARAVPELAGNDANETAQRLAARLSEARRQEGELREQMRALAVAQEALLLGETRAATLRAELDGIAALAGAAEIEALRPLLDRLRMRDRHARRIDALAGELLQAGDGRDEAALRAEAAGLAPEATAATLFNLEAEDQDLVKRLTEISVAVSELGRQREAMETGGGAEAAAQDMRNAAADLSRITRAYAVAKSAALVTAAAIERHRANNHDPLLARAGSLFETVTNGAFQGLSVDFGLEDAAKLVALRAGGEKVPVEGLSEGTRDQLYLALRLANLETLSRTVETLPFIGDDLFASFDEARVACGLRALAEAGKHMQVMLFTHHVHVAQIARDVLGDKVDLIALDAG